MVILRTYSELVAVVQEIDTLSEPKPATVNIEFTENEQEKEKAQSYSFMLSKVSGYQQDIRRRVHDSQQQVYGYGEEGLKEIKAKPDLQSKAVTAMHADIPGSQSVAKSAQKVDVWQGSNTSAGATMPTGNSGVKVVKAHNNELMLKPAQKIESIKAAANNELKALVQNIEESREVHDIKVEPNREGLVLLKLSVNDQVDELQ